MTTSLFLKTLLVGAMLATVVALVLGLAALFKSGKDASDQSNRMMRLRILFQAIAIIIFSFILFLKVK